MDDGIPVGKVAGFPVSIHSSVRPRVTTYWLAGFCGAVVLLASLLARELMHSIVARRNGVKVVGL